MQRKSPTPQPLQESTSSRPQTIQRRSCAAMIVNAPVLLEAKERRRRETAPPPKAKSRELFLRARQVVRDVVERRIQSAADALHGTNRSNRDECSDQTVLDRRRAVLISNQLQKPSHFRPPRCKSGQTVPTAAQPVHRRRQSGIWALTV